MPVVAIEFNGRGHHNLSSNVRDEIKEFALSSAGIQLVVFEPNWHKDEVINQLDSLLKK